MEKLGVVLCGLSFGGAFAPIYRDHPDVKFIGLFDTNTQKLEETSKALDIPRVYGSFEDVLDDPEVDAVHIVTPIPLHEKQVVMVLESGKHVASTVPMSLTIEGIRDIVRAKKQSGKAYMLMETTLYTRQYLNALSLFRNGSLGRLQLLKGCHYQDMENWPEYWLGLPPMYYATHAMSPIAALAGSRIEKVVCFGSGTMRPELRCRYGNPFPAETALLRFENGLAGEVTRTLFETARAYLEGFNAYGSKASLEWGFKDSDDLIMTRLEGAPHRGYSTPYETLKSPAVFENLPEPIRQYTLAKGQYDPTQPEKSLTGGAAGGHHGSHPHLVHEFIRSILEKREPAISLEFACNVSAAGILAHASALAGGKEIEIPRFE
ncbi:MAG: Gfo/Idh/MocA family oxidoreductase [Clostridiales bacterium]|nr:Gfo/Idh/MocA family oxidoreductase [Clostridiales bacterium]